MKRIILLLAVFLFIACSSDSEEPETINQPDDEVVVEEENGEAAAEEEEEEEPISFTEGLLVIGKTQDLVSGNLSRQPFQYHITSNFSATDITNLQTEVGLMDTDNPFFYSSDEGIIFFDLNNNPETGFVGLFPFYKNFKDGIVNNFKEFTSPNSLVAYGDYNGNIYGFHYDYLTLDEEDDSYDYFLKIINSDDLSERTLRIGRFVPGSNFKVRQSNKFLYIYNSKDLLGAEEASLFVIDLEDFLISDLLSNLPNHRFSLIKDNLGNCYMLSSSINYKYDVFTETLSELAISEESVLSNIFSGQETEAIVQNNTLYFSIPGIQPGAQQFLPATYNLTTGETKIFDFFEEITQFEQDQFPWQPVNRSLNYDLNKEIFYLGVSSYGLFGEAASFGVFAIDLEGNILEKAKIPISPVKIVN